MNTTELAMISLDDLTNVVGGDGVAYQDACAEPRGKFKRIMNIINKNWFKGPECLKDAIHPGQIVIRDAATRDYGTAGIGLTDQASDQVGTALGKMHPPTAATPQ